MGVVRVDGPQGLRYLLPVHRNTLRHDPMGSHNQMALESSSLLEWRLAGYVPQPEGKPMFMHEGHIAPGDAAGELKMVTRTAQGRTGALALEPPTAYSSVSHDGGHTWSVGQAEPDLYNSVSKAFFDRDQFGRHIYVYSTGPAWERKGLAYKVKMPGAPWGNERLFYDAGVHNSYPTLLEHAPGRFYAVWDSSNDPDEERTVIRFGRLNP